MIAPSALSLLDFLPCPRREAAAQDSSALRPTSCPTLGFTISFPMWPSAATARFRWDKRLHRSPSAFAITACARPANTSKTIHANSPSAKPQLSPAPIRFNFELTTPKKSASSTFLSKFATLPDGTRVPRLGPAQNLPAQFQFAAAASLQCFARGHIGLARAKSLSHPTLVPSPLKNTPSPWIPASSSILPN